MRQASPALRQLGVDTKQSLRASQAAWANLKQSQGRQPKKGLESGRSARQASPVLRWCARASQAAWVSHKQSLGRRRWYGVMGCLGKPQTEPGMRCRLLGMNHKQSL